MVETLAENPIPVIWVFGYGSLIWDPRFEPAETRAATLRGCRRSFCFDPRPSSPERPGLGLAIDAVGPVQGLAYESQCL